MPTYRIRLRKSAQKFIEKQPTSQRIRLYKAIYKLPDGTDIKKLKNSDLYRLRVGNYRILYSIDEVIKIIDIQAVDNRGDVYKTL